MIEVEDGRRGLEGAGCILRDWGMAVAVMAASESRSAASRISGGKERIRARACVGLLCAQAEKGHLSPSENTRKIKNLAAEAGNMEPKGRCGTDHVLAA